MKNPLVRQPARPFMLGNASALSTVTTTLTHEAYMNSGRSIMLTRFSMRRRLVGKRAAGRSPSSVPRLLSLLFAGAVAPVLGGCARPVSNVEPCPASTATAPAGHSGSLTDRERWNQVFSRTDPPFETGPNAFLSRCLDRIETRGAAVDIAMGQGRNAVLLAQRGFDVTGIDISDVAIEQAHENARAAGVSIHGELADVFTYDYGECRWDLVSLIYFNPAKSILERLKQAVKPGGYIVIEGFGVNAVGGPPQSSKYGANELLRIFSDWTILEYQDGLFDADWGAERKQRHVVRLLAQRPAE